jgi:hypothetical protein
MSQAYELSGSVKVIGDVQSFNSGFSKRELVVTIPDGNYPQDICVEFHKERADLLNGLAVGDNVMVTFNLRGREYNGRYYNTLVAWKLETSADMQVDGAPRSAPPQSTPATAQSGASVGGFIDDSDIPF